MQKNLSAVTSLRTFFDFLATSSKIVLMGLAISTIMTIVHVSASEGDGILSSLHDDRSQVTRGLDLETVNAAISKEALKDANNISHIAVFFNTGGRLEDGNLQPILAYEAPLTVSKVNTNNDDGGEIRFQYFVDTTSDMTPDSFDCSDIRLHVILDHKEEIYVTSWLGYEGRDPILPMDTGLISIKDVPYGHHAISLLPEGRISGCNNSGSLVSFGGTVVLYTR